MKKLYQQTLTYTFDGQTEVKTEKSSFGTLEKAIENAESYINRTESWMNTNVITATVVNKETKEVIWTYTA